MNPNTLNPENWNLAYREYLIRFALQRVSDYGTAEDLVQETFLSAWNARSKFRGECHERTWLTGILRNKIIDQYRHTGRRPSVLATDLDYRTEWEGDASASWLDRQADPRPGNAPQAEAEKREFRGDLTEAVTRLPGKMGRAFAMRELQGLSTDEITRELGITRTNLWVLIHRAKQNLVERLGPEWKQIDRFGEELAA